MADELDQLWEMLDDSSTAKDEASSLLDQTKLKEPVAVVDVEASDSVSHYTKLQESAVAIETQSAVTEMPVDDEDESFETLSKPVESSSKAKSESRYDSPPEVSPTDGSSSRSRDLRLGMLIGAIPSVLLLVGLAGYYFGQKTSEESETSTESERTVVTEQRTAVTGPRLYVTGSAADVDEGTSKPSSNTGVVTAQAPPSEATDPVLLVVSDGKLYVRGVVPPASLEKYLEGIEATPSAASLEVVNELKTDPLAPIPTRTEIQFEDAILFGSGESTPKQDYAMNLEGVVQYLLATDSATVVVKAYTDATGPEEANLQLSADRADSVKDYMVSREISAARITTRAFGEELASGKRGEEAQLERRVELEIKHEAESDDSSAS